MVFRLTERALRAVVAALVVTIATMVAAQVVFRYAVQEPIVWSEEFTTLCYQWLSYLGAALAVRYRAHYGVDLVVRFLGPRWRSALEWLEHAVVWSLGAFMVVYGWRIVEASALQMYPTLPFSVGTGYLVLPISGVLFMLMDLPVLLERRARGA
ncbi:MAG TPA: TRAP transporter small permease [Burkholderiales bacterium]|nr:TRAP transporter small permease [Burkholderiales bacterium]